MLGLAGESGSGKSTLAYGATRLLRQPGLITGGSVLFRPSSRPDSVVDILDASPQTLRGLRWRDLALVFQSAMDSLNPVLSVQAQLTDTLAAHRPDSTGEERRERAAELLELVGISPDRLRSFPHELSGGMKQRVMIAMALALDPQVVTHGRADHRPRRRHPAADRGAGDPPSRSSSASPCCSLPTTCRC